MIYIIAAIMAIAAFALVFYPLFQRRGWPELAVQPQDGDLDDLHSRRESAYTAIKDLDFEFQLGNLSEGDYHDLRSQYRQRAATVLKEMDELATPGPVALEVGPNRDDEIEEAVRRTRIKGKTPARVKAQTTVPHARWGATDHENAQPGSAGVSPARGQRSHPATHQADIFMADCPQCGAAVDQDDRFCAGCGSTLALTCTDCGAGLEPGDGFCTLCGARVAKKGRK